ncbi:CPBP family glutamic-type intramembrane protease [Niabella drilacis]|uniref:CAAX protease self-immunity n=1 Tax=Niabella drilacis (strain DSM 25811 / CCM 8410 / CCUG 62505 / LMG 26954 / E90) TaxID=1285928 RepID=A0A1G6S6K1_NIADE|nr:CAAX protease self-immunity [Niabella drilacis]
MPHYILVSYKIKNKAILILVSSILFALSHLYHILHFFTAFMLGILMNLYFVRLNFNLFYNLLLVFVLHALYNLYGILPIA